jgi:hypothetical protein
MAVHGVNSTAKGKTADTGDWTVRYVTGKIVPDSKNKPLAGLSYQAARAAAQVHTNRTGEFVSAVRA